MIRRRVLFSGRVQGVGFRFTACHVAVDYKVSGYVRNLPDGRVEAVVEGEETEIERFLAALSSSMPGHIRSLEREDGSATGEFVKRFDVRY